MPRDLSPQELDFYNQRSRTENILEQPEPVMGRSNLFGSAVDSLQGQLYGLAEAAGLRSARDLRLANEAEASRVSNAYYRQTGNPRTMGDISSAGDLGSYVLDKAVESAPTMGAIVGASLVNPAAAFGMSSLLGTADVVDNQRQAGGRTNLAAAVPLGLAYGASDMLLGSTAALARRGLGTGVKAIDDLGTSALANLPGKTGAATRFGVNLLKTGAAEAVDETFQELMNRTGRTAVSNEKIFDDEALDSYGESAFAGGLLGGVFGLPGAVGAARGRKAPTIDSGAIAPVKSVDNPAQPTNLLDTQQTRPGGLLPPGPMAQGSLFNSGDEGTVSWLPEGSAQLPPLNSLLEQRQNLRGQLDTLQGMYDEAEQEFKATGDADVWGQKRNRLMGMLGQLSPLADELEAQIEQATRNEAGNYGRQGALDFSPEEQEAQRLGLGYQGPLAGTPIVFPDGSVALSGEQELDRRYGLSKPWPAQPAEPGRPIQVDMFGNAAATREDVNNQNDPGAVIARQQWAKQQESVRQAKAVEEQIKADEAAAAQYGVKGGAGVKLFVQLRQMLADGDIQQDQFNTLAGTLAARKQGEVRREINSIYAQAEQKQLIEQSKAADAQAAIDKVQQKATNGTPTTQAQQAAPQGSQAPAAGAPAAAVSEGAAVTSQGANAVSGEAPVVAPKQPRTLAERAAEAWGSLAKVTPHMPAYESLSDNQRRGIEDLVNRGEFDLAAANTVAGKVASGLDKIAEGDQAADAPVDAPSVAKRLVEIVVMRPSDPNRPKKPEAAAIYDERMGNYTKAIPTRPELKAALLHVLTTTKSPQIRSRLTLATGYDVSEEDGVPHLIQVNNPATLTQVAEHELSGGDEKVELDPQKVASLKASISKQLGKNTGFYQEVIDRVVANDAPKPVSAAELGLDENGKLDKYQTGDTISEVTGTQLTESVQDHIKKRVKAELKLIAKDGYSDEAIAAAYERLSQIETRESKASRTESEQSDDETAGGRDTLFDNRSEADATEDGESKSQDDGNAAESNSNAYTDALAEALANKVLDTKRKRTRVALGDAKLDEAEKQKRQISAIRNAVNELRVLSQGPGFQEAVVAWNSLRSDDAPNFDQLPILRQASWAHTFKQHLEDARRGFVTKEQAEWAIEQDQRDFEGANLKLESQFEQGLLAGSVGKTEPSGGQPEGSRPATAEPQDVGTRAKAKLKKVGYKASKTDLTDEELAWAIKEFERLNNGDALADARKVAESRQAAAPAAETEERPATPFTQEATTEPVEEKKPAPKPKTVADMVTLGQLRMAGKIWGQYAPEGVKWESQSPEQQKQWAVVAIEQRMPNMADAQAIADGTFSVAEVEKDERPTTPFSKPQFSKGDKATKGSDAKALAAELRAFMRVGTLGNRVVVVQSTKDIPAGVRRSVGVSNNTQGFVFGGKAYLIADQIAAGNGRAVFMHEVGAHLGMEEILGAHYDTLVNKIMEWAKRMDNSQEFKLADKALQRALYAAGNGELNDTELVAYLIEEAVNAGIEPSALKHGPLRQFLQQVFDLFKKAIARFYGNPDKVTAQDFVDLAYGAARIEMKEPINPGGGDGGNGGNGGGAPKFSKAAPATKEAKTVDRYARQVGGRSMQNVVATVAHLASKAFHSLEFLHDVVERASKSMASTQAWYKSLQDTVATRRQLEEEAERIAALSGHPEVDQGKVNDFIGQATFEQKWWKDVTRGQESIKADPQMQAKFNALNAKEKEVVEAVFAHGDKLLEEKYKILKDAGIVDKKFAGTGKLRGPYAPLKRFGNYLAVLRSQELLDAQASGDIDLVAKLKQDPNHYVVSSFDTMGSAQVFTHENDKANGGKWAQAMAFEKPERIGEYLPSNPAVLQRVLAAVKADGLTGPAKTAMEKMVTDMYFQSLDEHHANTSGLKRMNRAGYDTDMLREVAPEKWSSWSC